MSLKRKIATAITGVAVAAASMVGVSSPANALTDYTRDQKIAICKLVNSQLQMYPQMYAQGVNYDPAKFYCTDNMFAGEANGQIVMHGSGYLPTYTNTSYSAENININTVSVNGLDFIADVVLHERAHLAVGSWSKRKQDAFAKAIGPVKNDWEYTYDERPSEVLARSVQRCYSGRNHSGTYKQVADCNVMRTLFTNGNDGPVPTYVATTKTATANAGVYPYNKTIPLPYLPTGVVACGVAGTTCPPIAMSKSQYPVEMVTYWENAWGGAHVGEGTNFERVWVKPYPVGAAPVAAFGVKAPSSRNGKFCKTWVRVAIPAGQPDPNVWSALTNNNALYKLSGAKAGGGYEAITNCSYSTQ